VKIVYIVWANKLAPFLDVGWLWVIPNKKTAGVVYCV